MDEETVESFVSCKHKIEGVAEEMMERTAERLAGQFRPLTFQKIARWV